MNDPGFIRDIALVEKLPPFERAALAPVAAKFKFRANDYYMGLINWSDPNDPIRKIVIPDPGELDAFGKLDASNEESYYVAPGCQHKYADTALLICNEVCGAYCRFCFRKRLFMDDNDEVVNDLSEAFSYIRRHPEISEVLLTGGDPLLLSTRRLAFILGELRAIPSVKIIRIGSKMPAFNPYRVLDDRELVELLSSHPSRDSRVVLLAHFNVPQELTRPACEALDLLMRAGVVTVNQTPILRGINDDPAVLAELLQRLTWQGISTYYVFQCRPTEGNRPFDLPLVQSYEILQAAKSRVSGLARRPPLAMSHELGKVEMVGLTRRHIYLRFHRARHAEDEGRFMIFHRDDEAMWLDDLVPTEESSVPQSMLDLKRLQRQRTKAL